MRDKRNQVPRARPRTDGQNREKNYATVDNNTLEDQCHPRKVFVGGLAHKTTTQHLRDHFGRFGTIVDAVVLRWPDGRSRGFGYVTFADVSGAASVMDEAHSLQGREVDVKRAVPGTNKLFIGGLPQNATSNELREHFETFGMVSDAVVMIDPTTGRSRGFGFVCFLPGQDGAEAVKSALQQYSSHRIRGKWIEVKGAAPPHKLEGRGRNSQEGLAARPVPAPGHNSQEASSATAVLESARPQDISSQDDRTLNEPQRVVSALGSPRKVTLPSSEARRGLQATPPGLSAPLYPEPDPSGKPTQIPWWTSSAWTSPSVSGYGLPIAGGIGFDSAPNFSLPAEHDFTMLPYVGGPRLPAAEGLQQNLELFLRQTLQNKMELGVIKGTPSESTTAESTTGSAATPLDAIVP
jgi:hypothetical protein